MKEYLVLTHAKKDIRELPKLEMAKSMNLINENKRAKNFAVLMFANKPNDFIPYAHVEIIKEVKGTDKMESKKFEGPVWIQAKKVVDYFKDDIFTSYTIRDNIRPEHKIVDNYPLIAFEELAVNAILHKEYYKHEYVGIYVYRDRISFVNHNRPLPPVTIQALNEDRNFDKRQYLNKELKEMFFALDLIESYGSGIRRAKEALLLNGSPELRFVSSGDNDDTTNAIIEIHPEFLEAKKNTVNFETNTTLEHNNNEFLQNKIIEIVKTNPYITIKEISEAIKDVSFEGIRYHIKSLKKSGILQRSGSKKYGKWDILADKI